MKRILILALLAIACTGCVYQPIQIDVYVPTTATVTDSSIQLNANKEVRNGK